MYTPFVEQRKNIDRSSTFFSSEGLFKILHADIADTWFVTKSGLDPKYCLFVVDLFTSLIYSHPMKNRSLLAKNDKVKNREMEKEMRIQADREFKQEEIKKDQQKV